MTRLLVSVRNAAEARTALRVGVDLLDLKEPSRGSLGAVAPSVVGEVLDLAAGRTPVSVALGEIVEQCNFDQRDCNRQANSADATCVTTPSLDRRVAYFKLGTAGCASRSEWIEAWRSIVVAERPIAPVAVVYADGEAVDAPSAEEILAAAVAVGSRTILVDTAVKDGRTLFDHWPGERLREFVAEVHRRDAVCVVGGSLTTATIPRVVAAGADVVAVRGAACRGSRNGDLDAERLREVRAALEGATRESAARRHSTAATT